MKLNVLWGGLLFFWGILIATAAPPRILIDPQNQTNIQGSTVTFEAVADGTPPLSYQWRAYFGTSFTNVSGATEPSLTLSRVQVTNRKFALFVTNSEGSVTSKLASLTVLRPPSFSAGPASTIAVQGRSIVLGASLLGNTPFRYQWFKDEQPLENQTNSSLVIPPVTRSDEGDYTLKVANPYGTATSRPARLRVTPSPFSLEARVLTGGAPLALPYRLFVPTNGAAGPFPLVLALHGAGEKGTDNIAQLGSWPQPMVFISYTNQTRSPLIFVAPQCPPDSDWLLPNVSSRLFDLLDHLITEFPVDTNRIYVTGLSMGGFGSWELVRMRRGFFAASVPIAGGGTPSRASEIKDLPIWNFHSALDDTVPVQFSRDSIDAVRAAGGRPIYTEYSEGGHAIWAQAWATPGLVEWTLAQRRGQPLTIPPDLMITNLIDRAEVSIVTSTNAALSGTSRLLGESLTGITWTNLLSKRGGKGTVDSDWSIASIPIQAGKTNPVMVIGSTYSFAPELAGSTTVNDFVRLVYQPQIRLSLVQKADRLRFEWSGGSGVYRLQSTKDLHQPIWTDVISPATSPQDLPLEAGENFFRILSE